MSPLRSSADRLRQAIPNAEQMLAKAEARAARIAGMPTTALVALMGTCLGMLGAYVISIAMPTVSFLVCGPFAGAAFGAAAVLVLRRGRGAAEEEEFRKDRAALDNRLSEADRIADFIRNNAKMPAEQQAKLWARVADIAGGSGRETVSAQLALPAPDPKLLPPPLSPSQRQTRSRAKARAAE